MPYSVSLLSTKADCLSLIGMANKEKETLLYRKVGLSRRSDSSTLTSTEIESTLITVTAELNAMQSFYDSLPEGPSKQDILAKIRKNEYKKFTLEQRRENYGVLALLERENEIATIEKTIIEKDDFIDQLNTRMVEIG